MKKRISTISALNLILSLLLIPVIGFSQEYNRLTNTNNVDDAPIYDKEGDAKYFSKWNECIVIKRFLRGNKANTNDDDTMCMAPCETTNSFMIIFKNNCEDRVEVMHCLQSTDKTWRCGQSLSYIEKDAEFPECPYNCDATGKYIFFTRKYNDQVWFPSTVSINKAFPD